tara:strand:+ start:5415 stop:6812 length:1398 start_codon:yes stop_codon:yes gene_type:complete
MLCVGANVEVELDVTTDFNQYEATVTESNANETKVSSVVVTYKGLLSTAQDSSSMLVESVPVKFVRPSPPSTPPGFYKSLSIGCTPELFDEEVFSWEVVTICDTCDETKTEFKVQTRDNITTKVKATQLRPHWDCISVKGTITWRDLTFKLSPSSTASLSLVRNRLSGSSTSIWATSPANPTGPPTARADSFSAGTVKIGTDGREWVAVAEWCDMKPINRWRLKTGGDEPKKRLRHSNAAMCLDPPNLKHVKCLQDHLSGGAKDAAANTFLPPSRSATAYADRMSRCTSSGSAQSSSYAQPADVVVPAAPVSVPSVTTRRGSSDDDDTVAQSPAVHLAVQAPLVIAPYTVSVATQQPPAVFAAPPSAVVQPPPDAEQLSLSLINASFPLSTASVAPVVAKTEEEVTTVSKPTTLLAKVNMIKSALGLDDALDLSAAIKKANEMMGLPPQGSLPSQAHVLLQEIGV